MNTEQEDPFEIELNTNPAVLLDSPEIRMAKASASSAPVQVNPLPVALNAAGGLCPSDPGGLLQRAREVAMLSQSVIENQSVVIHKKRYVRVEGWQTIASLFGCYTGAGSAERALDSEGKHIGYTAKAWVKAPNGMLIGEGEAFVGFDEKDSYGKLTWKNRAEYAGRAMAQTRAISRAARGVFAFVVALLGPDYGTTPAEEMEAAIDVEEVVEGEDSTKEPGTKERVPVPGRRPPSMASDAPPPTAPPGYESDETVVSQPTTARVPTPGRFPRPDRTAAPAPVKETYSDGTPAPWKRFKVPFGPNKGKPLGELTKEQLFGWWANYDPYADRQGNPKAKVYPEDEKFRGILNEVGAHYEFSLEQDGEAGVTP